MTDITLLDGGMGQELVRRSGDRPTPLWSTQVMMDHPGLVQQIHADYFDAGATVATANTYAILPDRLAHAGIPERFASLIATAMEEAEAARKAHGSGRIAGATAPLGGSYRPNNHPPDTEAVPVYAEKARAMAPTADLILIETAASLRIARAMLEGCMAAGRPVWLAVSVDDADGTRLRSGEPVADVVPLARNGGASALLVNCSLPEAMPAALERIAGAGLPFGAYANGFTGISQGFLADNPTVDALSSRNLTPDDYADHVMGWIDLGATILGGCCETGPDHIREIARRLTAAGHRIV